MAGHELHGAHVVQPIGQFDEDHPDIVRQGQQHLPEIFRLHGTVGVEDARYLGQAIDDAYDFLAELLLDIL